MHRRPLATLLLTVVAGGAYPPHEAKEIVVHVINQAGLSQALVKRAMNEVVSIYSLEGFAVNWSECAPEGDNVCPWPSGYFICISPEHGTTKYDTVTLGYSMLTVGRGNHAVVMWPDVKEFAHRNIASESIILGSTIAHELGHLITRTGKHDPGVMKPVWNGTDIADMNQRRSRFSLEFVQEVTRQLTDVHTATVKR